MQLENSRYFETPHSPTLKHRAKRAKDAKAPWENRNLAQTGFSLQPRAFQWNFLITASHRRSILTPLCVLALLCLLTACGATVTPPPPVLIKAAGSTSMRPLLVKLTAAYSAQYPHVTFDIQGGGSQGGQTAVETGQADIGLVSRPPGPLSDTLRLTPIARDAVAVIVHPQNRRAGLSLAELRAIFSGRLLNWQELDGPARPMQVVSREDGSGTRAVFEMGVMDNAVTPTAIVLPSSQAVVDFVAHQPDAIGYVSLAFVTDQVYAVPIDGQAPNFNTYFLTRDLSLLTTRQPQPEVDRFIEFALSQTGQTIIGERWGRVK